jgi:hypothetical protein
MNKAIFSYVGSFGLAEMRLFLTEHQYKLICMYYIR